MITVAADEGATSLGGGAVGVSFSGDFDIFSVIFLFKFSINTVSWLFMGEIYAEYFNLKTKYK